MLFGRQPPLLFSLLSSPMPFITAIPLHRIAAALAFLVGLASCAAPQKPPAPPPPKLINKNPPSVFSSLAQLRDYSHRFIKRIPEESIGRALPELNRLTWEPQEEYGVPYPMTSKNVGPMPPYHLFKASMTAEGVLCRVWIHTTRNVDLDKKGKLVLTGTGRHRILHLSLMEYPPGYPSWYGKRTDWPPP